jgi:hypothetical protein
MKDGDVLMLILAGVVIVFVAVPLFAGKSSSSDTTGAAMGPTALPSGYLVGSGGATVTPVPSPGSPAPTNPGAVIGGGATASANPFDPWGLATATLPVEVNQQ